MNDCFLMQRLYRIKVSYRCGLCIHDWKPCHKCRVSTWKANGYVKIYEHSDWIERNRMKIKQNLGQLSEDICIFGF